MQANYLYPKGEPVLVDVHEDSTPDSLPKPNPLPNPIHEDDDAMHKIGEVADTIGKVADAVNKARQAYEQFNPFAHLIPFLPVGGLGRGNPLGLGDLPEPFPFEPLPFEPIIIPV